jgi:integrase
MATRRIGNYWYVDFRWERERIRRKSPLNTKRGAEDYEHHLRQQLFGSATTKRKEVPTFDEWFTGRFWREWVIGRKNKPSEIESKEGAYRVHLKRAFGSRRLDQIGVSEISAFRATLVERGLSEKRCNNVMAVLSKALNYAADVELIQRAPKVGLFRIERPEIEALEFGEYARVLAAAQAGDPIWFVAVCLAGEAGLRIGEVKALAWNEVDRIAETITVSRQMRQGVIGTPKGRTRRVVPMTPLLREALLRVMPRKVDRTAFVLTNADGSPKGDNQMRYALDAIYDRAELPRRGWHILRHTFGTHAALCGVNPWRLMTWMGHKRIDETMRYVHLAEMHRRPLPEAIIKAAAQELDPDRRVLLMLGNRGHQVGIGTIKNLVSDEKSGDPNGI